MLTIKCKTTDCKGNVYYEPIEVQLMLSKADELGFNIKALEHEQFHTLVKAVGKPLISVYLTCDNPDGPCHTNMYLIPS